MPQIADKDYADNDLSGFNLRNLFFVGVAEKLIGRGVPRRYFYYDRTLSWLNKSDE